MFPSRRIPVRAAVAIVLFLALASHAQISAPTLSSPSNGAQDQGTSITFAWNAVSGASSYTLQLSQTSTFSSMLVNQGGIASTSQVVSGLVQYVAFYWRVSATGAGGTSGWSNTWSFFTVVNLNAPTLLSPANGAINQDPLAMALRWNASIGAVAYGLQVSSSISFASFISNQTGLTTPFASIPSLSYNATYFWRLNVTNAIGTSAWSSVWSFSTSAIATPTLVFPSNLASNQPVSLILIWNSVSAATSYALQVSTLPDFSSLFISQSGITATTFAINGLSNNTVYYWMVQASGPSGSSAWSEYFVFHTIPAPPLLFLPINNSTDISYHPVFKWQTVNTASSYTLQLSSDSIFSTTVASISGLSTKDSGLSLDFNAAYFWRVNATNVIGATAWSSVWKFTVSAPIPIGGPVLISPANNDTILRNAIFSWGLVAGATSYWLEIDHYGKYGFGTIFDTVLSTTQWSPGTTIFAQLETVDFNFYWRVRAGTGSGYGSGSSMWAFTISNNTSTLPLNAAPSPPSFSFHNSSFSFSYTLPSALPVELSLYSMLGRRTVILDRRESPGSYTLSLKNRNLPAGIYFLHFKAGLIKKRMKIVLPGG